jgi:hypothetical protein
MVDVTPELRRRIKIAAAERDVSVRDYVVGILERAVPTGSEEGHVQGLVTPEMIETFRRIRDDLMEGRTFTDDSTDLINEARAERMAEL